MGENYKTIKMRYHVLNSPSPYNITIIRPKFNVLEAVLFMLYLTMQYTLDYRRVGVMKGDQEVARKFYQNVLGIKRA